MKTNIFKKMFSLTLAASALFALTACGGSAETSPEGGDGAEKLTGLWNVEFFHNASTCMVRTACLLHF